MNLARNTAPFVGLMMLIALCPAHGQTQEKSGGTTKTAVPLIKSLSVHVPTPAYLIEADEKANEADNNGEAFLKAGDATSAMSAFQEALTYDPHEGTAYLGLARTYEAQGRLGLAVQTYRTLFYDWPGKGWGDSAETSTVNLVRFAMTLLKAGYRTEALAAYQQGILSLPKDRGPLPPLFTTPDFTNTDFMAAAYTAMGLHEMAWSGADDAPDYFERAISLQTNMAAPYFYRGEILKFKNGRAADAVAAFQRAEQLGGPEMKPFVDKASTEGIREFKEAIQKANTVTP